MKKVRMILALVVVFSLASCGEEEIKPMNEIPLEQTDTNGDDDDEDGGQVGGSGS